MLFYVPDRDHVFELCAVGILKDRMDEAPDAYGAVGGSIGVGSGAYGAFGGPKCEKGTASAVPCLNRAKMNSFQNIQNKEGDEP